MTFATLFTTLFTTEPYRYTGPMRALTDVSPVYSVCPNCKRELARIHIQASGHQFPVVAECPEHGRVTPMLSSVVNRFYAGNSHPVATLDTKK